jgi:hypothetical protein
MTKMRIWDLNKAFVVHGFGMHINGHFGIIQGAPDGFVWRIPTSMKSEYSRICKLS